MQIGDGASMPRSEILDEGPTGFTIPDPAHPGVFRLADGLCDCTGAPRSGANLITEVYVAPTDFCVDGNCAAASAMKSCTSKRVSKKPLHARHGPDRSFGTGGGTCSETALNPSPSVLGILVDCRDTMRGPLRSTAFGELLVFALERLASPKHDHRRRLHAVP
jgi:hypothetical protein